MGHYVDFQVSSTWNACRLALSVNPREPSTNVAASPKTLDSISDINEKQRIFVIGGSKSGKSVLINTLLNKGVGRDALSKPAKIGDIGLANGCTESVYAYFDGQHVIIDSIGFTDPRFTKDEIIDSMYQVLFNFRLGMSLIILVVKHNVFTDEEKALITIYETIFGKNWYQHALLVITHYDQPVKKGVVGDYIGRKHPQAYIDLLNKFGKDRIVIGTYQQDIHSEIIDTELKPRRQATKANILAWIDRHKRDDTIQLVWSKSRHIWNALWRLFNLPKNIGEAERWFSAFLNNPVVDNSHSPHLIVQPGKVECSICQEMVENDMYITPCLHVFHFDCVRVWILDPEKKCPNCRGTITNSYTYKEVTSTGTTKVKDRQLVLVLVLVDQKNFRDLSLLWKDWQLVLVGVDLGIDQQYQSLEKDWQLVLAGVDLGIGQKKGQDRNCMVVHGTSGSDGIIVGLFRTGLIVFLDYLVQQNK
eukprot:gene16772-19945_t